MISVVVGVVSSSADEALDFHGEIFSVSPSIFKK